jgi:hypothetical protein
MNKSLIGFRDNYLETLQHFLWQEWTALGVSGQETAKLQHVVDPEALLLFTCSLGRYDQRLFDEVLDWLAVNGRFLNVQRMRSIARREVFAGHDVLSAVAHWLTERDKPMKWKLLSTMDEPPDEVGSLFFFPDGRSLPHPQKTEAIFREHGFLRSPISLRGYSQAFPADTEACLVLRLRAFFGVNARCDVLAYLALNGTGHPSEVARELYYSQKAIHDVMADMERSGSIISSRGTRERTFRLSAETQLFLLRHQEAPGWVNWPILLATAEAVWILVDRLCATELEPLVENSEIKLTMKPLSERLTRMPWSVIAPDSNGRHGMAQLETFQTMFIDITA